MGLAASGRPDGRHRRGNSADVVSRNNERDFTTRRAKGHERFAKADLDEIRADTAGIGRVVEFAYRAPFAAYGKGFVVVYGSVPRLTEEYLRSRDTAVSSIMQGQARREVGAYVIDKGYFPTVESVKAAANVALLGPQPVKFKDGDKLIELRTVFLLIPR